MTSECKVSKAQFKLEGKGLQAASIRLTSVHTHTLMHSVVFSVFITLLLLETEPHKSKHISSHLSCNLNRMN